MGNIKICIVGPSKRFLSGISYYTIRLANILSSSCDVYVLNYRKLLPEFLFPGRGHIGKNISDIELSQRSKFLMVWIITILPPGIVLTCTFEHPGQMLLSYSGGRLLYRICIC